MHQAIWIINKGSCWKIGNGQQVRVGEDNWLPHQNGFKPFSPNINSTNTLMVKDLLNNDPFDWKYNFVVITEIITTKGTKTLLLFR
jgi:hypothetical protein